MWLLLVALCLAQGLEDAIPGDEEFYNPERSMNIVSASPWVCPKSFPRDELGSPLPCICTWSLGGAWGIRNLPYLH